MSARRYSEEIRKVLERHGIIKREESGILPLYIFSRRYALYRRFLNFSYRLIKMNIGEPLRKDIEEKFELLGITDVVPDAVYSAAFIVFLVFLALGFVFSLLIGHTIIFVALVIVGGLAAFLVMISPRLLATRKILALSNEFALGIFMITARLIMNPNLEDAIRFTALHLPGEFGNDLRMILWWVESGKYPSMCDALAKYAERMKKFLPELYNAIHLILSSEYSKSEAERRETLNWAVKVITESTINKAKLFAVSMKAPLSMIYMLGIVLPSVIVVAVPIVVLFTGKISADAIYFLYILVLPTVIFLLLAQVLVKRPSFFRTLLTSHPKWPRWYEFFFYGNKLNIFTTYIAIIALFMVPFLAYKFTYNPENPSIMDLIVASFPSIGIGAATFVVGKYYYLTRKKEIEEIRELEKLFADFLIDISNELRLGASLEKVFQQAYRKYKDTSLGKVLKEIIHKVYSGIPIQKILTDRSFLNKYPSPAIQAGIRLLAEASDIDPKIAADVCSSYGKYLKMMYDVNIKLRELVGEITGEMKVNAKIVLPLLLGVTVSTSLLIVMVLCRISRYLRTLIESTPEVGVVGAAPGYILLEFFSTYVGISLPSLYLVLSVYLTLVSLIMTLVITDVEETLTLPSVMKNLADVIPTGIFIYNVIALTLSTIFVYMVRPLLAGL